MDGLGKALQIGMSQDKFDSHAFFLLKKGFILPDYGSQSGMLD